MAAFSAGKTEYGGIRGLTPQLLWVRNLAGGPCLYFRLRIPSNSKNAFCLVSGVYAADNSALGGDISGISEAAT